MHQTLFYMWGMYSYLYFSIPVDSGNETRVHNEVGDLISFP
jgi:hypothetical protein